MTLKVVRSKSLARMALGFPLRVAAALLVVASAMLPRVSVALPDFALAGSWHGDVSLNDDARKLAGDSAASMVMNLDGDAFDLRLALPVIGEIDARLALGEQPGVYEPRGSGGLMRMFGGEASTDPLKGSPLIWARDEGSGLVIYRLQVTGRDFRLAKIVLRPEQAGIRVEAEERRGDRSTIVVEGLLS